MTELVGRGAELDAIGRWFDSRGPTTLVIDAPAGLGKTTVWAAAVDAIRAGGTRVLATSPTEAESSLSYSGLTDLLEAEIAGDDGATRRLSDPEVLTFIALLSGAGNETVARLLGWAGFLLARNPGERAKLVADSARIPNAVEELLRYEAPSPVQARTVMRDVPLHGRTVPAGARILLLTGSAGRDEREFEAPDEFRVDRRIERHVSFGYGIHFCLGASLARMEGRIALEETLRRFPEWTVDDAAAEMVHTSTVRGWAKLPIRT